jgi:hypothetical protein
MRIRKLVTTTQQKIDVAAIEQYLAASTIVRLENFRLLAANGSRSNWCWAVVAQGVSRFYDPPRNMRQCEIAAEVIRDEVCCVTNSDCNESANLSVALRVGDNFDRHQLGSVPFATITDEIKPPNKRPVCCRKNTNGGHFIVISATLKNGSDEKITIVDPVRIIEDMSYLRFKTFFWYSTYFTQR